MEISHVINKSWINQEACSKQPNSCVAKVGQWSNESFRDWLFPNCGYVTFFVVRLLVWYVWCAKDNFKKKAVRFLTYGWFSEQVIWNVITPIGGKLEVRWVDSLFGNAHVPN